MSKFPAILGFLAHTFVKSPETATERVANVPALEVAHTVFPTYVPPAPVKKTRTASTARRALPIGVMNNAQFKNLVRMRGGVKTVVKRKTIKIVKKELLSVMRDHHGYAKCPFKVTLRGTDMFISK